MGVEEVVQLLREYNEDDGETLRSREGPEAAAAAEDMQQFLAARLEEDSLHASLWQEFTTSPDADEEELIGVLEALTEADPAMARRLNSFVVEYHAALAQRSDEGTDTGEETITTGEDALDTAVSLDSQEGQETDTPYGPHSLIEADYDSETEGEGTYLYGNVRSGDDVVGGDVDVDTLESAEPQMESDDLDGEEVSGTVVSQGSEGVGFAALDVSRLFTHISDVIAGHPVLDPTEKDEAESALDGYRTELMRGDEADVGRMQKHLATLQRLAPDVAKALVDALDREATGMEE